MKMNPKIEKLLRLLSDEQALIELAFARYAEPAWAMLVQASGTFLPNDPDRPTKKDWWEGHKAGLAFRLRDVAVKNSLLQWRQAEDILCDWGPNVAGNYLSHEVWVRYAQPEHYIVGALIAQELQADSKQVKENPHED